MANQKISQMPSLTASELAAGDLLAVVDVSDVTQASSGSNKKITLTDLQSAAVSAGTANGVLYLNGSKVATSGSALTFDGLTLLNNQGSSGTSTAGNALLGLQGTTNSVISLNVPDVNAAGLFFGYGGNPYWAGIEKEGSSGLKLVSGGSTLFTIAGSEQMRLTSTGLGIGTSSPGAKLEINGDARLSNGSGFTTTNSLVRKLDAVAGAANQYTIASIGFSTGAFVDQGNIVFNTNNSLGPQERLRIDPAGNLGLGVTPSAWGSGVRALQLQYQGAVSTSADGFHYRIDVGGNYYASGANTYNYLDSVSRPSRYMQYNGAHQWFTAPSGTAGDAISFTQAMTLDVNGNLGIGTTTPSQRIDAVTSGGSSYIRNYNGTIESFSGVSEAVGGAVYGTGNNYPVTFFTNGTERVRIDSSGNLLVGTTSSSSIAAGGVVLGNLSNAIGGAVSGGILTRSGVTTTSYVGLFSNPNGAVGSITVAGATTAYNTSSDYRLKNITGPIISSGTYIDSLNPVEGTWKADGSTFVGLIAHEVQEVSRTQVATGEKDGAEMQAMDYSNSELIANLIAEVKSLRARVAALESN